MNIYTKTKFSWREAICGLGGVVLFLVATLLGIGLFYIYSASYQPFSGTYASYPQRQIMWVAVALIPFFFVVSTDYNWITKNALVFYIIGLVLLLITPVIGICRGGARRWIQMGPLLLQTSEVMKLAIIPMLAHILTTQAKTKSFQDLIKPLGFTVIPMVLVMLQPDLGTSLVFLPIAFSMIFAAGIHVKHLMILVIVMINLAVFAYFYGMHEYQRKRVQMFIFQDSMTQEQQKDAGYHLCQSKIAHGNGGLWGRGWQRGTQNRFALLPERHTDFIFAVIGEELGFVGTFLILFLYFLFFASMLLVSYTSLVPTGQLMVVGVVALMSTQTIVNTAMTVGMAPITGLPLPFVSYGGSSLLFNFIGIGLVVSVSGRKIM